MAVRQHSLSLPHRFGCLTYYGLGKLVRPRQLFEPRREEGVGRQAVYSKPNIHVMFRIGPVGEQGGSEQADNVLVKARQKLGGREGAHLC